MPTAGCYVCGCGATTKEHFPPKCFFPRGMNLQLKTVPSCPVHNGGKSKDDQYLLAHICMHAALGDNLAKTIFNRSVEPGLKRSEAFRQILVEGSERLESGARRYPVDIGRFDNFFDGLVSAVYFDRYGTSLNTDVHQVSHVYLSLQSDDLDHQRKVQHASDMMKHFFEAYRHEITHFEAANTGELVYSNKIIDPVGDQASITIAHTFYGVFDVVSFLTFRPLIFRGGLVWS